MSSNCSPSYDDECDSNYLHRIRRPVVFNDVEINDKLSSLLTTSNCETNEKVNEIKPCFTEPEQEQPLNLSIKKRDSNETNKENENSEPSLNDSIITTTTTTSSLSDTDDNDLTDLGWLTTYNLKNELKLKSFGSLTSDESTTTDDDEADGSSLLLQSKLNRLLMTPTSSPQSLLKIHLTQPQPNLKPPYSFSLLIYMAIDSSIRKCLTVKEIYSWITNSFPYYRNIPSGSWKNSIRHNLSHNQYFRKVDKNQLTSRDFSGKGSLWYVNPLYKNSLIDALKKTPTQHVCSVIRDVSEREVVVPKSMTISPKSAKKVPQITSVTRLPNSESPVKVTDFYKKACNELSSECTDFDAASALLMIKSSTNDVKSNAKTRRHHNTPMKMGKMKKLREKLQIKKKKQKGKIKLNIIKRVKKSEEKVIKSPAAPTTPYPTDDHTYSTAKNESTENESEMVTQPSLPKNDDDDVVTPKKREFSENNEEDSSEKRFLIDTDTRCSENESESRASESTSSSDRLSAISADKLRNALLELSRAAEMIEDKKPKKTSPKRKTQKTKAKSSTNNKKTTTKKRNKKSRKQ